VTVRITLLAISCSIAHSAIAAAQVATTGPHAIEIQVRERRLNGSEQPRFTPFSESERWVFIDSVRATNGARELFVTLDQRNGDSRATLVVGAGGAIDRLTTSRRERNRRLPPFPTPEDSARFAARVVRMGLFDGLGDAERLALPATKVWDIVPTFRPRRLVGGERWTDTLSLIAEAQGNRQALSGTRVSTIVRDTTIDDKRLWVIRDTAAVRYDERALIEERTLDTVVAVSRSESGVLRGVMVYDPDLGLFRARSDTLTLAGTAELQYADGRTFRTPARDERTRHWDVYDPSQYNARQRVLGAARERTESGGVVFVPANDIDERLTQGSVPLRDSLVQAWQRATDPNERAMLYRRMHFWVHGEAAFQRHLDSMRIAGGDSAFLLETLVARIYTSRSQWPALDTATMRQLIGVMADPGIPFAFGMTRDPFYEDLAQALSLTPPAIVPDTSRWPCTPAACRLLAEQWNIATEPRLRQLGLVAHVMLDPKRWADTLAAQPQAPLLVAPRLLVDGVGATWPASTRSPIPAPNADWRAWGEWMNGTNPAYQRWQQQLPAAIHRGQSPFRFEGSHATAIRFTEARTGRDIVGELRQELARATSDSARAIFEYMLIGLDALDPGPEDVAAHFRSRSPVRSVVATRELALLFRGSPPRADSATAFLLQDRLIAMTVGGGKPWRWILPLPDSQAWRSLPAREVANETTLLLADSLAPALRAKWSRRVAMITDEDWKKRSLRTGGTLFTLTSVTRVGPFARLGVESSGRVERRPEQAPWLYYASTTYFLMELDGEWVIVEMWSSIT